MLEEAAGFKGPAKVDLERVAAGRRSSFPCCRTHQSWVCRWYTVDTQYLARPHSALIPETQPMTGLKGRKKGDRKPRTKLSEIFLSP